MEQTPTPIQTYKSNYQQSSSHPHFTFSNLSSNLQQQKPQQVVTIHSRYGNQLLSGNPQQQQLIVGGMAPAKTRNITQMPALKSSPAQQQQSNNNNNSQNLMMRPMEEYNQNSRGSEYVMIGKGSSVSKEKMSLQSSRDYLLFKAGGLSARRDTSNNIGKVAQSNMDSNQDKQALHQRGSSMFEVKRSLDQVSTGLANHQKLKSKALDSGEALGLEEHIPQNTCERRNTVKETEGEEEDIDFYHPQYQRPDYGGFTKQDDDQAQIILKHQNQNDQSSDGSSIDDFGTEEFKIESPNSKRHQFMHQDSPGLQFLKLDHGSSQEGNIPKSSNSSDQSPHTISYLKGQATSSFHYRQFVKNDTVYKQQQRVVANIKDSFDNNHTLMTPQILKHDTFRLNPKPVITQVSNQVTDSTPLQQKTQFAHFNQLQPSILRQQPSHSSFLSAQNFKNQIPPKRSIGNGVGSIPPKSQLKKQDCNETVEDENEVDVVVSPNLTGVALMQTLDVFQREESREQMMQSANKIPNAPTVNSNTSNIPLSRQITSSNVSSKPPITTMLSGQKRIVYHPQHTREQSYAGSIVGASWASRSSSEQKFGKLQKLESKTLKDEVSPAFPSGITSNKIEIPLIDLSKFQTGDLLKKKHQEATNQQEQRQDSSERFGDLSHFPQVISPSMNFIGPNPVLQKNQQVHKFNDHRRIISSTARPLLEKLSDDGDEEHLQDPKDPETEDLKLEYLKLKKTLDQLKTVGSSQHYESKKSFDRRKTAQPQSTNDQQKIIDIVNNNASKFAGVRSPQGEHSRQRMARPTSSCLTEQQNQNLFMPSSLTSELNFSKANIVTVESRLHPPPQPQPIVTKPVLSNSQTEDFDRLSHSPPEFRGESQRIIKQKLITQYPSHLNHPNTTKVTRRRKFIDQNNQSLSSHSSSDQSSNLHPDTLTLSTKQPQSKARLQTTIQSTDPKRPHHLVNNTLNKIPQPSSTYQRQQVNKSASRAVVTARTKKDGNATRRYSMEHQHDDDDDEAQDDEFFSTSNEDEYYTSEEDGKGQRRKAKNKKKNREGMSEGEGDDEEESRKKSKQKKKSGGGGNKREQGNNNVVTKKSKDRKQLKININMNSVTGAPVPQPSTTQYSQKPDLPASMMQSNEELLQRQIIQSQQFLLAAFAQQQYQLQQNPQQTLLLQQQMALQQQQLLMSQQSLYTNTMLGTGINQNIPLGMTSSGAILGMSHGGYSDPYSGMIPTTSQSMQNPILSSQITQRYNFKDSIHSGLLKDQSQGNLNNPLTTQSYSHPSQQQQRDQLFMGQSLDLISPSPNRHGINASLNTYNGGTSMQQAITKLASPRDQQNTQFSQLLEDQPPFSRKQPASTFNRQQSISNQSHIDPQQQLPSKQIHSRNNLAISQHYSSPIKNLLAVAAQQNSTQSRLQSSAESHHGGQKRMMMMMMRGAGTHLYEYDGQQQQDHHHHHHYQTGQNGGLTQRAEIMRRTIDSTIQDKVLNNAQNRGDGNGIKLETRKTGQFGGGGLYFGSMKSSFDGAQEVNYQMEEDTLQSQQATRNKANTFLIENGEDMNNYQGRASSNESIKERVFVKNVQVNAQKQSSSGISQNDVSNVDDKRVQQPSTASIQNARNQTPDASVMRKTPLTSATKNQINDELLEENDKGNAKALMIGFEDTQQIKDPFLNKPVLKNRQVGDQKKPIPPPSFPVRDLTHRSKSAKGTPSANKNVANRLALNTTKPSIDQDEKQLKSPMRNNPNGSTIKLHSPNQKDSISQMKRAVIILQKDIPSTVTHHPPIQVEELKSHKPAIIKRPGTSKAHLSHKTDDIAQEASNFSQKLQQQQRKSLLKDQDSYTPINDTKSVKIDLLSIRVEREQKATNNFFDDASLDPLHNKDLAIEILMDTKHKPGQQTTAAAESGGGNVSLAEMFQAKRKTVVDKINQRIQHKVGFEGDYHQEDNHKLEAQSEQINRLKREKTKQELFELRRQMMKSKVRRHQDNFGGENDTEPQTVIHREPTSQSTKPREMLPVKDDLMGRLAKGKKTQIDRKEMKRLTNKNYNNLPEIKKKREDELKKQEHQARKAATQEYLKQLDETRKRKAAAVMKRRAQLLDLGIKDIGQ